MNVAHVLTGLMPFGIGVGLLAVALASFAFIVNGVLEAHRFSVYSVATMTWLAGALITVGIFIPAVTSLIIGAIMIRDGMRE